jgi:outer membrane protein OmpA-like peptidoglycan-associated protein
MKRMTFHCPGVKIALGLLFAMSLLLAVPAMASGPDNPGRISFSSESIARAQGILEHEGYLDANSYTSGKADGPTVFAVRSFQVAHTLVATGRIDADTMAELTSHAGAFDADRDTIADDIDQCPDTPIGTLVDARGCPRDADNDAVSDNLDRCPDTPFGARVDAFGCPEDTDQDTVYNGLDHCPDTPTGARVDSDGCPIDSDHDAVFDGLDRCPGTPDGTKVDARGCPEEAQPVAVYEQKTPLVLEGVQFEPDTANLTAGSRAVLDRVAESLRTHPDVQFEVSGYTDTTSTSAHNLRLSQRRAEAVCAYLVKAGIDSSRLVAKGYGEDRPIADNDTASGRARNRRVEIAQTNN